MLLSVLPWILTEQFVEQCHQVPTLAKIALDHLPVQGSSVASERAFSSAGLDDDKRRGGISANNFGCLQFVKAHCRGERHREIVAEKLESDVQRAAWIDI